MIAVLLAVLLAQADPQIEKIERLNGPVRRPYRWAPLAVTLSSTGGYKGDVTIRSELGILFTRRVEIAAGGRRRVLIAAIDPLEVSAGAMVEPVPPATESAERLIAVVEGAEAPPPEEGVHQQRIARQDFDEILSWGAVDVFDGRIGGISAVDPALWTLAPRGDWVPVKKDSTVLFATFYMFATFVLLVWAARRGTAAVLGSTAVVAVLFGVGTFVFFPTGALWGEEYSCEVTSGETSVCHAWFFRAESPVRTRIDFPYLVKPVLPQARPVEVPFTIRQDGTASSVEGLELPAGGSICFVGMEIAKETTVGLGEAPSVEVPLPQDADFRVLVERFVTENCRIGRSGKGGQPVANVRSPDLAEAVSHRRWFVRQRP